MLIAARCRAAGASDTRLAAARAVLRISRRARLTLCLPVCLAVIAQEESEEGKPKVATLVSSLANYSSTVEAPVDPDASDAAAR